MINFSVSGGDSELVGVHEEEKLKFKIEEGAPYGVRVVATPNALRPISVPLNFEGNGEPVENRLKLPPLASYANNFSASVKTKRLDCRNCGEECVTGRHECNKEEPFMICGKCFNEGKYGENKSIDDFKYIDNNKNIEVVWTEEETLLLLESVLKHGDDWELVVQSVPSKSKLDCISKLIQLPFGELTLGSTYFRDTSNRANESTARLEQVPLTSAEPQDSVQLDDTIHEQKQNIWDNVDFDVDTKGLKKQCIPGNSLMKQVALISTMVSPDITAAAADAAISALCKENQLARGIFNTGDAIFATETELPEYESPYRARNHEELETKVVPILPEAQDTCPERKVVPLPLRIKAANATALGAAAARSKLLADQEEREIEHQVSTIIQAQMKKMNCKVKLLNDLEEIIEQEYSLIAELEDSIVSERIGLLQRVVDSRGSRWRVQATVLKL